MLDALFLSFSLTQLCPIEKAALNDAADRIEYAYVLEREAKEIAADLRAVTAKIDAVVQCGDPKSFTSATTKYLRQMSGDGHFYIEPRSDDTFTDDDWLTSWRKAAPSKGYGIRNVTIYKGNIGHLQISSFYELEASFARYDAAFELLSDTDAFILDLRGNGGGSPETERPLIWTFLTPGLGPLLTIESRIESLSVPSEVPVLWKRYGAERPLVVLIDGDTFSAPEAVAYTLQSVDRAVIIGEASGGGAHLLDSGVPVGEAFTLYVPTRRPVGTRTGGNWEGVGVLPDIEASSEDALETAISYLRAQLPK
ncbi:MAG: S41 family peptidase [Pseudomonadota bacterium]